MTNYSKLGGRRGGFSLRRVLLVIVPLACFTAGSLWFLKAEEHKATRQGEEWAAQRFGLNRPTKNRLAADYTDGDGDLLADRPDEAECISPDTLYFAYIPGEGPEHMAETWRPLTDAIAAATGKRVEFKQLDSIDNQLVALADGELHITGINTGTVPRAVNASGFIPMFVIGNEDGTFGYKMKFIVPHDSPIRQIEDLQGHRITFTSPDSNSGFKAPVVMLMYDYDLRPGRDYDYAFSTSHDQSILGIANRTLPVAAVASDMLDRAIARGDIDPEAVRTIYTSERFPSATLGCVYNLDPQLTEKISQAIAGLQIDGTALQTAVGLPAGARFVPVSYKDEWALIRRSDDALGELHTLRPHKKKEEG
jgi:phosphonate transport system substrate-binding protein